MSDDHLKKLDIHQVLNYLPHRYPFLLIDKVLDYSINERLIAVKNVSANEPFFQGHFPAKPIMPGVLILESMAQASCVLAFLGEGGRPENMLAYFVGINEARFRKPVEPGDSLRIEVEQLRDRPSMSKYNCLAKVDGHVVCDAQILCKRQEI